MAGGMVSETLLGLVLYAVATSVTPGPNNMMVLASGVNFGLGRSMPHVLGISLGFGVMVVIVGTGLGAVFQAYPMIHTGLRWVGAAYLLYLSWKIATAASPVEADTGSRAEPDSRSTPNGRGRPMGFFSAAAFQWVNPKAWVMALGAIATYLPPDPTFAAVALLAMVFAVVNAPCVSMWAAFGVGLRRFLTRPGHVRRFNITMAVLLVLSLYPIILP